MSVIDEDMAELSELSKLPALQGLLEQMEAQAARIIRNELGALVADSRYGALDELGRKRLRNICMDFHDETRIRSTEEELQELEWRVQALAENRGVGQEPPPDPPALSVTRT